MKENKIATAETREVLRSQITLANYNPRKMSKEAKELLKKNMKMVGLLGGIVWNEETGNLVSGHQRVSIMDDVNHYDQETGENDYLVKVEVVHFSDKKEREQNLFMNNRNVQGEFDSDMLREMFKDVDYELAGFTEFDLQMIGVNVHEEEEQNKALLEAQQANGTWAIREKLADENNYVAVAANEATKNSAEHRNIDRSVSFYNDTEENQIARHNEVQKIRDRIKGGAGLSNDGGMLSYVILSFSNPEEKMDFCQMFDIDPYEKTINGSDFMKKLDM